MAANKWMKDLLKLDGSVQRDYNPFLNVVQCPSPSTNFIFGNTQGLPKGYTMVLYGPQKAGKSVLCNAFAGQAHRDDPEAFVVKFNTEARETIQMTDLHLRNYGIDPDRYYVRETNRPDQIFDMIDNQIKSMVQGGQRVSLIIIDSINGIMGRRAINNEKGIMQQQIGDEAKTIQDGLKLILGTIRKYKIALIITSQIRAEMDQKEIMRGNTVKMAAAYALKHFAEYFVYVEPNLSAGGKVSLLGEEFNNSALKDLMDHPEKTAHKVRVFMKDSSVGPKGRVGEFTFDDYRGIINTYEEVFLLGVKRGILAQPNNRTYILPNYPAQGQESKWTSKADTLIAIRDNELVYKEIVKRVREQDAEAMRTGKLLYADAVTEDSSDLKDMMDRSGVDSTPQ